MLKIIAIVLGIALLTIVALAFSKSDSFTVQRSILVKAPPEAVFPLVNNLSEWAQWSPWAKLDPAMEESFSGATSGLGAVYEWQGNSDVGQGRMEIVDTTPSSHIAIKLDFIKPYVSSNRVDFRISPVDEYTEVTWMMTGPMPFLSKLISVFVSMDKMIGANFESGLAQLKQLAES